MRTSSYNERNSGWVWQRGTLDRNLCSVFLPCGATRSIVIDGHHVCNWKDENLDTVPPR